MAYNEAFVAVFNGIYGAGKCSPYNGAYQWSGGVPSAAIIAAVEALPTDATELYNLSLAADEMGIVLQALLTGEQWVALLTWQKTQYEAGFHAVMNVPSFIIPMCRKLCAEDSALCDQKDALLAASGYRDKG